MKWIVPILLSTCCCLGQQAANQKNAPATRKSLMEDHIPMPARDLYFDLKVEEERLRKEDRLPRNFWKKEQEALDRMLEEIKQLNKRIYGARQAELARRARPAIPQGMKLGYDVLDYPRVDGSTSTHPLGVLLACRLLGAECVWTNEYKRPGILHRFSARAFGDMSSHHSMRGPYNALTKQKYGIGYSVYFYEHFMAASPYTRPLAVDGVRPTAESIRNEEYPYVTKVYGVIRKDEPNDSNAHKLRDWILSDEGQALVGESVYVPLPTKGDPDD